MLIILNLFDNDNTAENELYKSFRLIVNKLLTDYCKSFLTVLISQCAHISEAKVMNWKID
ncbi:MAG: hypothetical protein RJB18_1321 [Pseudomonadota bacterium]|jgi:hypothetical protein